VDKQIHVIHNPTKGTNGNLIEPKEEIDLKVDSRAVKLKLDQVVYSGYTLFGRATKTLNASSDSDASLVAKISWPEISRENEAIIIEEARKRGKEKEYISLQ